MGNWNDGPGDSRKYRNRAAFMLKVTETGGHWVWRGDLNFAGQPSHRLPSGLMDAAHLVAWEIFKGSRQPTLTRVCDREHCVLPAHWRRPAAPPREKKAAPVSR